MREPIFKSEAERSAALLSVLTKTAKLERLQRDPERWHKLTPRERLEVNRYVAGVRSLMRRISFGVDLVPSPPKSAVFWGG